MLGDNNQTTSYAQNWTLYQLIIFRTAFVFLSLLIIPIEPRFYERLFSINLHNFHYYDLDTISLYFPWFANNSSDRDYSGLGIALSISAIASLIWTSLSTNSTSHQTLYYWLNVAVRYKIAIAMFHFGFVKAFPLQMPFPSISQLNTNLGDFTPGKLYWTSIGASQGYEIFAGICELIGAALLLSRKSSVAGSLVLISILTPVWAINIFYDAGVELKSVTLLLFCLFLLSPNIHGLIRFFIYNERISLNPPPNIYKSSYLKWVCITCKALIIAVFVFLYGSLAAHSYYAGETHMRSDITTGNQKLSGFYDVSKFSYNDKSIPYSQTDSVRWQNVIIENWNTFSINIHKSLAIAIGQNQRTHEYYGTSGRAYYAFSYNPLQNSLLLTNKRDDQDKILFTIVIEENKKIKLDGNDAQGNHIVLQLDRINKEYPLIIGRKEKYYSVY